MTPPQSIALSSDQIAADLSRLISGQVRFRPIDRQLYSTDASIYQVEPIGVVVPASIDEAERVLDYCGKRRIPLLPRGGGTSLAGQCTSRAIVLDLSAFCRQMLSVDAAARIALVEPGLAIDEINRQLLAQQTGLFYAADPATSSHAAIGGTIGNNAAGARSIRYGRTSENIAGIDVALSTGERTWLAPGAGRHDLAALRLAHGVTAICSRYAEQICTRFPKTVRRNAGYGLDMIQKQLDAGVGAEDLDLSGLICGSEGTLALVLGAKLKLTPLPLARGLAIVAFESVEDAVDRVQAMVATHPTAVELIDDVVLNAAQHNAGTRPLLSVLPPIRNGATGVVLYVEYTAERSLDEIEAGFSSLRDVCAGAPVVTYRDADSLNRAWSLRKAGEPLLHSIAAHRKPQTFVEDNAIPAENLPRFVREFRKLVARHGTTASYWAHASVGVLHVRPLVNVHDPADRATMQKIAVEVADLARDCGGVMSGEHGDGRIRGPLLARFFGPDLMQAFREIKQLFDPLNILNPGDIVAPGPVESITTHLRVLPDSKSVAVPSGIETFFTYDDQHGFDGAVEMCNGAGFCRKTVGGTMCPSYRATLDEQHCTRGRANALRIAITGQVASSNDGNAVWNDPGTIETLDLCLSCKACKTECPSNVDVARLKAEYTAQRYREKGEPLSAKLFGHVRILNRLGALAPDCANAVARWKPARSLINRLMNLPDRRSLPPFARSLYATFEQAKSTSRPIVVLYADCFTTYNEPHIGHDAIAVLEALGYEVQLPYVDCCGRAMISTGLMDQAIASADRTLAALLAATRDPRVHGIVVCEPSCLSAVKDDWLEMKLTTPLADRKTIAAKSWLVEEFVERFWSDHPLQPAFAGQIDRDVILHGHCHQKALWGDSTSANALRRVAGDRVTVLDSGCCGMAGSFGFASHRFDLSMQIGELSVFPPVRNAPADAIIVAPGTSCRHQIKDGTQRHAIHPIELIARCIG